MAGVGCGRSKASNFGCRRSGRQCDFVSEISGWLFEVGNVGEAAAQLGQDLEEGRQATTAKNHSNGHDEELHEDTRKCNDGQVRVADQSPESGAGVIDVLKDGNGSACKWM